MPKQMPRTNAACLKGTVARPGLIDSQRRARRSKVGDDVRRVLSSLIPGNVGVVAEVEVALACGPNDGSARRIVALIKRHRPRLYLDEYRAGVHMPRTARTDREEDALNGDVHRGLGLDVDVPVVRDPLDVEVLIIWIAESGSDQKR